MKDQVATEQSLLNFSLGFVRLRLTQFCSESMYAGKLQFHCLCKKPNPLVGGEVDESTLLNCSELQLLIDFNLGFGRLMELIHLNPDKITVLYRCHLTIFLPRHTALAKVELIFVQIWVKLFC
ncbi:hypothetical protein FNW02_04740 [Komarekiella sp. 'clone 1']|uniref:Uncharacterized protein n=1 Tax=Komarekiella delphini-convector SJRDD-AB1 TaxID=2593771 RepID=A0AA40STW2_9NOST|nr:hypothetical protein [Komarekiella delphini-convector SJRDD-AB1]